MSTRQGDDGPNAIEGTRADETLGGFGGNDLYGPPPVAPGDPPETPGPTGPTDLPPGVHPALFTGITWFGPAPPWNSYATSDEGDVDALL